MEPRILYSADLAAGLALGSGWAGIAEQRTLTQDGEYGGAGLGTGASLLAEHAVVQPAAEIAFVDMSVARAEDLVSDLQAQRDAGRSIEVVRIAADEDGIARIAATLDGRADIAAIHVLSHGADGLVHIGSARLDAAALSARGADIAAWGRAMNADADLLLYGCDVAASPAGERLLAGLATLTGADVAASADLTGAAGLGGNWAMEARVGPIEAATAIGPATQAAWQGLLATAPTVSAIADQTILEDTPSPPIAFTVDDVDTPANSLILTASSSDTAILAPGGIVFGGGGANRTLTLTPLANASGGPVTVTVNVSDGELATSTSFRLWVTPVNDAPAGSDRTLALTEDTPYVFAAADFGYRDPDDALADAFQAVKFATLPAAGTLTSNGAAVAAGAFVSVADIAAGRLVYLPGANGNGIGYAALTFQVQDGGGAANGGTDLDPVANTLTFDVAAVNDAAPVNDVAAAQTVEEDKAVQIKTARGTAITVSDVDGGILTTTVSTTNGVLFAPGNPNTIILGNRTSTISITGLASDINVVLDGMRYNAVGDYNGPATLTVTTSDGTLSTTDVVDVTLTAVADIVPDAASTQVNTPVTIDVLGNDTFKNTGAAITAVNGTPITGAGPAIAVPNGSVALVAGKLVFTPQAGFVGAATFTYTVSSGGVDETGNVDVTVSAAAPPVNTVPGAQTIDEDTTCVFGAAGGNAISVADADSATLITTVSASSGTVTAQAFAGATIGSSNGTAVVTISGTAAAINGALQGLRYASGADYNGHATLTVATSDGVLTSSDTISITVTAVADIAADSVGTSEDAAVSFNALTGTNGASADSFEDPGRALAEATQGSHGSVSFSAAGDITYTPDPDYSGTDSFSYTVDCGGVSETAVVDVNVTPVNDAPVAAADSLATAEDTPLTIAAAVLLGNDTDIDTPHAALSIASVASGAGGTAVLNADGSVSFTPNAGFNGAADFSYTVSDGALTSSASVSVAVTAVNDAPRAVGDSLVTTEDTPLAIAAADLLANDTDADTPHAALSIVSVASGVGGTAVLNANGSVSFTPGANFNGLAGFSYTVSDGAATSSASVSVTVGAVNDGPAAAADSFATSEDTPLTIAGADLLANDTDVDTPHGALSIVSVASGGGGTAVLNADGSVSFTPGANFNGLADFSYTVSDGALASSASVSVTVTAVNDAPRAFGDSLVASEDTPLAIAAANLLANDTDIDTPHAALSIASVASGAGGTAVLNADGSVSFTPGVNFNGAADFSYTVSDGALTSSATVSVAVGAVNDAPVAVADSFATGEDTPITLAAADLLANDSDIDTPRAALSIASVASGVGGTAVLNANGSVSFTPGANFNGLAGFSYTVSDGALTSSASVSVAVSAVNDAPRAVGDSLVTTEDTPLTIAAAALLANDTDVDTPRAALSIVSVASGSGGTAVLNADGSVSFTPNAHFRGAADFTYTVSDGALTDSGVVTVAVKSRTAANAPVAAADSCATSEDTPLTIAAADLLANDTDADTPHAALSIASVASGAGGTAVLNADGSVTFTPGADFNGLADFTYTVTDGLLTSAAASVSVTVGAVNDAPVAAADSFATSEDTPLTIAAADLLANDTDIDTPHGALSIASVASGMDGTAVLNADGSVTFTPGAGFNGAADFSYTVSDGTLIDAGEVTVAVRTRAAGKAPVAASDSLTAIEDTPLTIAAADLLANDTDADTPHAALSIASVASGAGGTAVLNADGSVSFTPNANFNGAADFSYTVTDGLLTGSAAVSVAVGAVNDAPAAVADSFATGEDTPLTIAAADLLANDTDIDTPRAALSIASVASGAGGSAVLNADGSVTFTPNASFNGAAAFSYTLGDGALTSSASVSVAVGAVNDAPVAAADSFATSEDTPLTIAAADLLANDGDVDTAHAPLSIASVASGAGGTAVLNADGSVTFTPGANFHGAGGFSYKVTDGALASAAAPVSVAVTAVNDAPRAVDDSLVSTENTPLTVAGADLLANDTDVDTPHAALSIVSVASGTGGTAVLNADGSVTFTPNASFSGAADFSYTVSDGALTSSAIVSVAVGAVDHAPVAVADSFATSEDTPLAIAGADLLANDTDADTPHAALSIVSVASGAGGTAVLNADGSVSFRPNANFNGLAGFTYTVSDGAFSSSAFVDVAVAAVNDAPVAVSDSFSAAENTQVTYSAAQLLANDLDVDDANSDLRVTGVSSGTGGTAVLNPDGSVTFTPDAGFNGVANFTYTVTDGRLTSAAAATVTASVAGPADPVTEPAPVIPAEPPPVLPPVTTPPAQPPVPDPDIVLTPLAPVPDSPVLQHTDVPDPSRSATPGPTAVAPPGATPPQPEVRPGLVTEPEPVPTTRVELGAAAGAVPMLGADLIATVFHPGRELLSFGVPQAQPPSLRAVPSAAIELRALPDAAATESAMVFARWTSIGQSVVASAEDVGRTLRSGEFPAQLDQLRGNLQQELDLDQTIAVSVAGVSFGLSILYVVWLIRGGVLMGSYLSALPAWRVLDPLPVLSRVDGEAPEEDDEALDAVTPAGGDPLRGFG